MNDDLTTIEGLANAVARILDKENRTKQQKQQSLMILMLRYGAQEWDEGLKCGKEKPLHMEVKEVPPGTGKLP